ncbi:hypothetical protein [Bradyrhizobium sp. CCBAU 51753]|uniref:hypothetical protein n=1 Tax=Bradyrhizobium sp. CCBAU 51753 TaxID=1325100 RepID=UPI00188CD31A|nr:hypothetical protein [Bradyrhizobium sp. CCBAU 51753]
MADGSVKRRPALHRRESIWIGWDPREAAAFAVARESCRRHLTRQIPIHGLLLDDLIRQKLYTRPFEYRYPAADKPQMWDLVSDAPQSTQHANARFFIAILAKTGWALFTDGDVLFRGNACRIFEQLDNDKAVYCVKHDHTPAKATKMDGQLQTRYARKNWTSVMAVNVDHPSNKKLFDLEFLNTTPGRDLHAFCWLTDKEIGELDPVWNHLVGTSDPQVSATIAHFTNGVPDMAGYENQRYGDEWRAARDAWVRG